MLPDGLQPLCPVAPVASQSSTIVAVLLRYVQSWYCTTCVAATNAVVERSNLLARPLSTVCGLADFPVVFKEKRDDYPVPQARLSRP